MNPAESRKKRGRPEVIPAEARWKLRVCYVKHYKQWGPSVLSAWASREGLGNWSTGTIDRIIRDLKGPPEKKKKPKRYEITAPGVMWSEDGTEFVDNRKKKELLVVQDECSRYKLNHRLVKGDARQEDVCAYLKEAFEKYGPPLVLKQDREGKLNSEKVKELLDRYDVELLNGPSYYPEYNGKKERGMRDVKGYVRSMGKYKPLSTLPERIDEAMDDLCHVRPRPVLRGRTAWEVLNLDKRPLPDRRKFREEVNLRAEQLKEEAQTPYQENSARRRAIEEVLLRYGLLENHGDVSTNYSAGMWTN